MTRRVLVIGNCQAQYLGTALAALTDLDVRVNGPAFEGVHFQKLSPPALEMQEALEWFRTSPSPPLALLQTTPLFRDTFAENFAHDIQKSGFRYEVAKFPYVRFAALDVRDLSNDTDADKTVRRALRSDAIFNETALFAAGLDADALRPIKQALAQAPSFYMNAHFTGRVHAEIVATLRHSALFHQLGQDRFEAFLDSIRADIGVSHVMGPLPHPRIMKAMGLDWSLQTLAQKRYAASVSRPARREKSTNGVIEFTLFRMHHTQYVKASQRSHLLACFRLYKQGRLYPTWTRYLFDAFMARNNHLRAATVLFNRLSGGGSNASLFAFSLPHLPALATFPAVRRLAARYAKAYPDSSTRVINEAFKILV